MRLGEVSDGRRVQRVGLCETACCLREVAYLPRIDDRNGNACRCNRRRDGRFVSTRRLHDDESRSLFTNERDEVLETIVGREALGLAARSYAHIDVAARHVDADETLAICHCVHRFLLSGNLRRKPILAIRAPRGLRQLFGF